MANNTIIITIMSKYRQPGVCLKSVWSSFCTWWVMSRAVVTTEGESWWSQVDNRGDAQWAAVWLHDKKSTTDAMTFSILEKYREGQKSQCVFVDLWKAYDRVPREELW